MKTARQPLGQHWLRDRRSLEAVAEAADVEPGDTVLEVGPGLGTLTEVLAARSGQVIAVEFDTELATKLQRRFAGSKVEVIQGDIRSFDLRQVRAGYKVAANIPYYLTSLLVRRLLESPNPPSRTALLVQKEVAERLAAEPGQMSVLAVSAQFYADVQLHEVVPAALFDPPPQVDSQIVSLTPHEPPAVDSKLFFRLVKAGFAERRKQLRSSLAGGLQLEKAAVVELLEQSGIDPSARAQELSLEQWLKLYVAREAGK